MRELRLDQNACPEGVNNDGSKRITSLEACVNISSICWRKRPDYMSAVARRVARRKKRSTAAGTDNIFTRRLGRPGFSLTDTHSFFALSVTDVGGADAASNSLGIMIEAGMETTKLHGNHRRRGRSERQAWASETPTAQRFLCCRCQSNPRDSSGWLTKHRVWLVRHGWPNASAGIRLLA